MASAIRTGRAASHPTMADRIAAARVLAAKVMPDLKQVSVDDGGSPGAGACSSSARVTAPVTDVHYEVAGPTLEAFFASDDFVRVLVGPFGSGKTTACMRRGIPAHAGAGARCRRRAAQPAAS